MLRPTAEDLATRPIMRRNVDSRPNQVPLSLLPHGAAAVLEDSETMTQWSPFGSFNPRPYHGGHDPLSLEGRGMMAVPQSGMYNASPNPFPNNGQFDRPNSIGMAAGIMRLRPHTSAHRGQANPTGPGPTMLFRTPPVFSYQTTPIPAVGV